MKFVLLIFLTTMLIFCPEQGGDGFMLANPTHADFSGQAMITFSYDDGYRNNYLVALPLHEQYGIPATFNIVTDWVINDNRYSPVMTIADVLDAAERGFEIASHSVTHGIDEDRYPETYPDGKRFADMTDEQVEWELSQSKQQLLSWGLKNVDGFVLPYSSHAHNKELYTSYYTYVRGGRKSLEAYPPVDRHDLSFYFMTHKDNDPTELKAAIDEAISSRKWLIVMMHHVIDDEGDSAVTENSRYYWYASQLEEALEYVASKPKSQLLPVTTRDGCGFASGPQKIMIKHGGILRIISDILVKQDGMLQSTQNIVVKHSQ